MDKGEGGFSRQSILILIITGFVVAAGWYVIAGNKMAGPMKNGITNGTNPTNASGQSISFSIVQSANEQHKEAGYQVNGNLITLYLGERNTGGYNYMVDRVVKAANRLDIYTTETKPGDNCLTTQAFTYPQVAIQLSEPADGNIAVHKMVKTQDC
ncbi:protease complex subunit PrcB family protein [Candidatus Saccharibacteria bacterium]|nr:protease complex subunit PrcB family protein [Candidatus Saccharibacteria bacterium]